MTVGSWTLGTNPPTATKPLTVLRRGIGGVWATLALWQRRSHDRRQLAMWLSTSGPGFLHDTSIACTDAYQEANKPFWRP